MKREHYQISQHFTLQNSIGHWDIKHRYRLEERFLMQKTTQNLNRFRYQITGVKPLTNKGEETPFSLVFFDEVFIHLNKANPAHYFDQNWAFVGFNYKINDQFGFEFGYMNQYLVKPDGIQAESNHTLILSLKHKIRRNKL
jgi:hypothetical protein